MSMTLDSILQAMLARDGVQLRKTFQSPYEQFESRIGQPFKVTGVITEADADHDAEVLPMFAIRFADGFETEAWPEEILTGTSSGWTPADGSPS